MATIHENIMGCSRKICTQNCPRCHNRLEVFKIRSYPPGVMQTEIRLVCDCGYVYTTEFHSDDDSMMKEWEALRRLEKARVDEALKFIGRLRGLSITELRSRLREMYDLPALYYRLGDELSWTLFRGGESWEKKYPGKVIVERKLEHSSGILHDFEVSVAIWDSKTQDKPEPDVWIARAEDFDDAIFLVTRQIGDLSFCWGESGMCLVCYIPWCTLLDRKGEEVVTKHENLWFDDYTWRASWLGCVHRRREYHVK